MVTADVTALRGQSCTVMLPKASAAGVAAVVEALGEQTRVLALVETAAGMVQASSICALPQVVRLAFGSIDFSSEVGVAADDREALLHARASLVLASVAADIAPPLDGVTTDLTSAEPTRSDAAYASPRLYRQNCPSIHPVQIAPVGSAFQPSPAQLSWARSVLEGAADGASKVDGRMVDAPVLERAPPTRPPRPSRSPEPMTRQRIEHTHDVLNGRSRDGDVGSDGSTPQDRASAVGFHGKVAETIAINPALAISGIELINLWH